MASPDAATRHRRIADQDELQRVVRQALERAGIHRVRAGRRPRPGYIILSGTTDRDVPNAVLRYSTDDDAIVRQCGRILRHHGFLMTYFIHEGRPSLRIEPDDR